MSDKIPFQKMFDVEMTPTPRPAPVVQEKPDYAPPGGSASGHRKPLPRGESFLPKNSLVKWSPR